IARAAVVVADVNVVAERVDALEGRCEVRVEPATHHPLALFGRSGLLHALGGQRPRLVRALDQVAVDPHAGFIAAADLDDRAFGGRQRLRSDDELTADQLIARARDDTQALLVEAIAVVVSQFLYPRDLELLRPPDLWARKPEHDAIDALPKRVMQEHAMQRRHPLAVRNARLDALDVLVQGAIRSVVRRNDRTLPTPELESARGLDPRVEVVLRRFVEDR